MVYVSKKELWLEDEEGREGEIVASYGVHFGAGAIGW